MIEWIIAQQGILSLTLVLLVASEHFFTSKLGVSLMYKLWALVPCCLLVNNLPMSLVSIPANHITRYIVGVKPTVNNVEIEAWLTLWLIGACMMASYILVHHRCMSILLVPGPCSYTLVCCVHLRLSNLRCAIVVVFFIHDFHTPYNQCTRY